MLVAIIAYLRLFPSLGTLLPALLNLLHPCDVNHSADGYARDEDGDGFHEVHVNTMEVFWSLLRSWLRPHRGISQEKLPIYLSFLNSFMICSNAENPYYIYYLEVLFAKTSKPLLSQHFYQRSIFCSSVSVSLSTSVECFKSRRSSFLGMPSRFADNEVIELCFYSLTEFD